MTTVFVHGVPETPAVWDRLRAQLDRESTTLTLPAFGCPRPAGFGATMQEYEAWLVAELEGMDQPIDLVGHDWGGILTARLVTTRDDLVRSWVTDAAGAVEHDFSWHDTARIWQTPGEGEAFFAGLMADRTQAAALLAAFGVPSADATGMAEAVDQTMVDAILDLYRSATDIGTEWGHQGHASPQGLVLVGGADPLGNVERSRGAASALGAELAVIEDGGHWWPLDSPEEAAEVLQSFWARCT